MTTPPKKSFFSRFKFKKAPPPRSDTTAPAHHAPKTKHTKAAKHEGAAKPVVEGILQLKGKFGFVLAEDGAGDVLVQGNSLQLAMEGDRVRVRVSSVAPDSRRSGNIIEVLIRAHSTMVGSFQRKGNRAAVVSEKTQTPVLILDMGHFTPAVNDIAVVKITRWPTETKVAGGTLIEVLGPREKPGVELETVVRQYDLAQKFSDAAEREALMLGSEVPESAWKDSGRELFFDQRVFTIDGADAKDFDDAVSLQPIDNGWRLGVHIADVAQYVRPGMALDTEALERGTSVYFVGSVLPMLPFPLSDGLCSLRPDVVRLTLSCVMDINRDGVVFNTRVVESAIRSCKRFTYNEVEDVLKGNAPANLDPLVAEDVRKMGELARLLRGLRFGRGSLDFDFPEPYVKLNPDGQAVDIQSRERLEAHRLIEEFMLLANESVARFMEKRPFIYRVHESPDPARLEKLQKSLETMGLEIPKGADLTNPSTLGSILKVTEGTPRQTLVHLLVLRSLKQAIYSPMNKGHYGLASKCYTHFTSPIRRYPDTLVHRMVKERLHNIDRADYWTQELTPLAAHCSKRERVAVEAEREYLDIQKTRFMEPYVGEEFDGVVTSVTNFGLFIQLTKYFVEGLVHVTSLGDDYYVFDEARMSMTGQRTHKLYALGTKVKVKLVAANVIKHQLDFQLVGVGGGNKGGGNRSGGHSGGHRKSSGGRSGGQGGGGRRSGGQGGQHGPGGRGGGRRRGR
jgi:ribonuclease R